MSKFLDGNGLAYAKDKLVEAAESIVKITSAEYNSKKSYYNSLDKVVMITDVDPEDYKGE